MANKNGIITRKDIIEDEALKWGTEYEKQVQIAIDKNKEWAKSILEIAKNQKLIKDAPSQKEYLSALQEANLEVKKSILLIKEKEAAELSADKIKRSNIATMEAERKAKQAVTDAENKAQKAKEQSKKATIEERVQNEINNKALKQEALERLGLVTAYTKLNKSRTDAKNSLRDLIASESASTAEIKKAQKEFELLDGKVRKADQAVGDFTKNVGNYPLKNLATGLKDLVGAFGIAGGITAFAGIMKDAYATIKQFDQGIADLKALTGATGKDLDYLKNKAIDLGKSTKGGAIAVVEAYKLIGSAKPELLDNVNALNQVTEATLTLAKAAGMEMPEAATALTDAMNQFGADASQAAMFVDALANGAKYGSAEIPQTTEALLKFGAVARSSNINIKESTALIQLLAENGIKGADAGTALRNVLLKISAPDALPKEAQKAMKDLGISFEILKDKSIPIQEKFEALKPLLADNGKLLKAFGFENVVAARNILEHTDRLKDLTSKMEEVGTAEEQAIIRSNTLQGKTEKLSSTYDSLVLSIGNGSGAVSEFFTFFIDGAKGALDGLIRLNTSWDELYEKAKQDGSNSGVKSFQIQFNNLAGKGGGSDAEVALSIKISATKLLKFYKEELKKKEKEIKEINPWALRVSGPSPKDLNIQKEELIKNFNLQAAIIREAKAKIQAREKTTQETAPTDKIGAVPESESDADRKTRLAKELAAAKKSAQDKIDLEKKLSDSLFELQRQRLEQLIKFNQEIVSDDTQSDEMRIQALSNSQNKQEELLLITRDNLLKNDTLTTNDRIRINEDYSNKLIDLNNTTKKEIDRINKFDLAEYQAEVDAKVKAEQIKSNNLESFENDRFKNELELLGDNQKAIEEATKKHEKNLWQIKHDGAVEVAKIQYDNLVTELEAFKKQSDGSKESTQIIADLELKLSEYKKRLTELGLENFKDAKNTEVQTTKEKTQEVLDISSQMLGDLARLSNAFSQGKIAGLDNEIEKNNEFYDKQIELAGEDARKKDLLQKERDKKNAVLEKKKKEEQNKQAKIEKAVSIAQIAIATSLAIIKAAPNPALITLAAITGAIALATAIATPLPKYRHGRKGGPAELAVVGDGGVSEIIERRSGMIQITPASDTLVKLNSGDKVHSSVDEYLRLQKASMLASISMQGKKVSDFQASQIFDKNSDELLKELKEATKAIKNIKTTAIVHVPKIDMSHEVWKMNNKNWNK